MGKVKWGAIAAVVAAVVILLLAAPNLFSPNDESGQPSVGSSESPDATTASEQIDLAAAAEGPDESDVSPGDQSDMQSSEAEAPVQEESNAALQEEAESFVSELAGSASEPVAVDRAEAFVGLDRPLVAKTADSVTDAPPEAGSDEIGVEEQTLEPGVAATGPDSASSPETAGLGTEAGVAGPEVATTAGQGAPQPGIAGTAAEPVRQSIVDLPLSEEAPVTIAELLGPEEDIPSDAVFYVHTVKEDDNQGIWGIVHHGIVGNFAEGVAIHRGETTETYRIDIPSDADERRADSSSSFLGKLIHEKSRQSYVYNFQADRIGKNPDLIIPGQEIVIVAFTPEELVAVYKHFVRGRD